MTNIEVIKKFINREKAYSTSMLCSSNKLFSYDTCIAEFYDNDTLIINETYYSNTTSKHFNMLCKEIRDKNFTLRIVNKVPKETKSLLEYGKY